MSCPAPRTGEAHEDVTAPSDVNEPIRFEADRADGGVRGAWTLEGNVVVTHGERSLRAEHASYDPEREHISAPGAIEYIDPNIRLRGRDARYAPDGGAQFSEAQVHLTARQARGSAQHAAISPDGHVDLRNLSYTTCPWGNDDWLIRAETLHINQRTSVGTGRNVRLDFMGVPLLFAPFITFPVGNERKSGFLFPDIGTSSSSGFEVSAPWYWNLAPNYDATLTPAWYGDRGPWLGAELRYLSPRGESGFYSEYLPHDDQFGASRSLLQLESTINLTERLRLTLDGSNVSDERWFEDFGRAPEATSTLYLNRVADLSYLGAGWQAALRAQNFQVIDPGNLIVAESERPYTIAPQFAFSGAWPEQPFGLTYVLEGEASRFDRRSGVTGVRLDVMPELRMPLRRAGVFLEPAAAWRYTAYDLQRTAADADASPTRSLPIFSVDSGLILERNTRRAQRVQTLEPRLFYVYVPYRDQAELPVFGTTLADLGMLQLFRTNRYIGSDRVSDANQVSIGVTSRLIDEGKGQQLLAATLGQIFYFDRPRVTLPGEAPITQDYSGPIAELSFQPHARFNLGASVEWNAQTQRAERGSVQMQYVGSRDHIVNLGYRQLEQENIRQVDASAAWAFTHSISAFGRVVYSFDNEETIDRFAGVEYRSCCWRVRLVGRHYLRNRLGDADTSVLLQLQLNGLSSLGFGASDFLEQSIRGYVADEP